MEVPYYNGVAQFSADRYSRGLEWRNIPKWKERMKITGVRNTHNSVHMLLEGLATNQQYQMTVSYFTENVSKLNIVNGEFVSMFTYVKRGNSYFIQLTNND